MLPIQLYPLLSFSPLWSQNQEQYSFRMFVIEKYLIFFPLATDDLGIQKVAHGGNMENGKEHAVGSD